MAQHTITIDVDSIGPDSLTIHPGDSVSFELKGRTDLVTVEFDSSAGSPFSSQSNFGLDGSNTLSAQAAKTVRSNANGKYTYKVVPDDRDPPGTLSGDIEVTPDW